MPTNLPPATPTDEAATEAFVGRLFDASVGAFDILAVYLGDRLGLYRALATGTMTSPAELAARAGIDERYAREWLEQQAVTGILEVDDAATDPHARRYHLPRGHAEALVDPESPFSMAPLARSLVACVSVMPQLLEAYRTGGGVPWSAYGTDGIQAQGDFNRPWLISSLGTEYLPAVTDVHQRLTSRPPARVADVACGVGWAAISIARAYPGVLVDGFDLDEESIALATANAAEAGVADRVTFHVRDAADPGLSGRYDLAIIVEAVHDLSRPVAVLSAMRRMLAPGGVVIVADEKTSDSFSAPGDATERLLYGFSITCCLPAAMTERPTAATGTVMRLSTMRRYADEAGFGSLDVLPLEHDLLRFYRLAP